MIIILTGPTDPHADAVIERLERRGAEYLRFDEGDYPARANLSFGCAPDGRTATILRTQERTVDLERVSTIWRRRPSPPEPPAAVQDPAWRRYVELECEAMLTAVWHTLPCRWLPAPTSVLRRADLKPLQLKLAAELGLELPPTLITSDPQAFLDFYREHDGDLVSKLLGTALTKALGGSQLARFTQRVTRRDVGYADSIRYAPMIFQAYVPKQVELRITVVGEQVFAAEIHSQKANRTRVDWRRYDMTHTLIIRTPCRTTSGAAARAGAAARPPLRRHRHGAHPRRQVRVPRDQPQRPVPVDRDEHGAADQRRDLRPAHGARGGLSAQEDDDMNSEISKTTIEILDEMVRLAGERLSPRDGERRLRQVARDKQGVELDVLWEQEAMNSGVHYDALLRVPGQGTVSVGYCPDRGVPGRCGARSAGARTRCCASTRSA
ncbi:hypothetical protein OV079_44945 [Nannocystis pusilla]|uniref:MvdD-like pre-ATP grasp domain-containing protein n=1 Tax=Nannocystis pusilla TaxID=889268 RepID=A0A9X3F0Q6_9BACT|nr:hypothetical protein [Nannocystis pusilla]MCY1012564.1 hypothetical protein [Nannocystis pusilla]